MASSEPPLVLLHPFLLSGTVWQDVAPLLSSYHQVFTPTLFGHSGGPQVQRRPATIWDVIDAAEAYLDENGLQRPHLAGNSLGGFVAIELARRGAPAHAPASRKVHKLAAMSRLAVLAGPVGPLVFKSAVVRRQIDSGRPALADVIRERNGTANLVAGFRSDITLADKSKVSPTLPAPRRSRVPGRFRAPVVRR
jgi:pimeloyl-ACP methyl ester carboxylesterase